MLLYPCCTHIKTVWVQQIYFGWCGFQRCCRCCTLIFRFYFFFEVFMYINFINKYIIHVYEEVKIFYVGTTNGFQVWILHFLDF
jgi:hypothetical protein